MTATFRRSAAGPAAGVWAWAASVSSAGRAAPAAAASRALPDDDRLVHLAGLDLLDLVLDLGEVRRLAVVAVRHLDQVQAEVGRDEVADLADFHAKRGLGERFQHGELVRERADVAAVLLA